MEVRPRKAGMIAFIGPMARRPLERDVLSEA